MTNSDYTVSFVQVGQTSGIVVDATPIAFNSPVHLQAYEESIPVTVVNGAPQGELIKIAIQWENADGFSHVDTIERYFGISTTVFSSNCDDLSAFDNSSNWGISTNAVEGTGGLPMSSPNQNYAPIPIRQSLL